MGKARKLRKLPEDSNLNRFKNYVNQFSQENVGKYPDHGDNLGVRKDLSRKERRKAERKLQKMKKHAFKQRIPIPTKDSLDKERKAKEEEMQKQKQKEKQERKKKQKKKKKKRKQEMKKEEEEAKKKTLYDANKFEDKEIKKYEKLLRLNKRKSKTISLGFRNDGLDFLLEAVDRDKLKELMETGEELESAEMALGIDQESGSDQPEDDSDNFFEDDDDDMQSGSEDDSLIHSDEDSETMPQSESDSEIMAQNESKTKTKKELINDIMNSLLTDKNSEKIKKQKKSVTFSNDIEESTGIRKESNTESLISLDEKSVVAVSKKEKMKKKNELKPETQQFKNPDLLVNQDDSSGEDEISDESEGDESISGDEEFDEFKTEEEEVNKSSDGDEDLDEFQDSDEESDDDSENEDSLYTEDIYGRLRDKAGNIIDPKTLESKKSRDNDVSGGAYVPPAKRLAMAKDMDEKKRIEIERMKKQLKGLLNRVSEGNMSSVSNQIEEIFRSHSRAETCEALTEIIMGASSSSFLLPERLMMEQCMLIAILHGNVGTEIGASFLQYFAKRFKTLFDNKDYLQGKEMDNLVMFLSNLYNFKIVHSVLLFDVMKKFADRFGERDIEILLVILKNVGFSLRKDDAAALKEFIVQIQSKASTVDTEQFEEKSKVQFMLEIILHIKNNNMRKIPNYDPSHLDHLRKLLRNFIRGSTSSDSQLRICLEDLFLAEEQGKWWIVGSAWTGRELPANTSSDHSAPVSVVGEVSEKILELARKQRMNTDVRKNIFCVIMTSEDYVDAFEKLLRLGLKHQPEREIIHVVVDLCLQEKKFNPFYAYLLQKFCEYDRRFQMTLQFNLWDKFKETSNLGDQRINNICKLLTHLIATQAMSLSLFKVLEFSELDKYRVRLMKTILSSILLDYDEHITKDTFTRLAPLTKLQTLREGLKLFMKHFLLKKPKKKDSNFDAEKFELLTQRVEIAEKALNSGESQFRM